MALALLRPEDIGPAFDWLIANATIDILYHFRDIINYFTTWWLTRVTPRQFSVFALMYRTNNVAEAYHRVLLQRLGVHPSLWIFTGDISMQKKIHLETRLDFSLKNDFHGAFL